MVTILVFYNLSLTVSGLNTSTAYITGKLMIKILLILNRKCQQSSIPNLGGEYHHPKHLPYSLIWDSA